MASKAQSVPFQGTKEQEAALKETIASLKDTKGCLMPIMQKGRGDTPIWKQRPILWAFYVTTYIAESKIRLAARISVLRRSLPEDSPA